MRRTIADELKDEGRAEGAVKARRETLLDLLRDRFDQLPPEIVSTIEATDDGERLREWTRRLPQAENVEDLGILGGR